MQGKIIEYGFQWGPATVERGFCNDPKGWVTLLLKTKKYPYGIQIYVTKTGKVRMHCAKGEWRVGAGKSMPNARVQALKQALEALEYYRVVDTEEEVHRFETVTVPEAIAALRQAIKEAEEAELKKLTSLCDFL